jgi:hypothetical protein
MHKIEVFVPPNNQPQFYFRHWEEGKKGDTRIIEAIKGELRRADRERWENIRNRIGDYPASLYAVLCHREASPNFPKKTVEWIDAVPQFGINVNPNIWTATDGTYNLSDPKPEWRKLTMADVGDGQLGVERWPDDQYSGKRMITREQGKFLQRFGGHRANVMNSVRKTFNALEKTRYYK